MRNDSWYRIWIITAKFCVGYLDSSYHFCINWNTIKIIKLILYALFHIKVHLRCLYACALENVQTWIVLNPMQELRWLYNSVIVGLLEFISMLLV
jgi:hypothetical protein